MATLTGISSRLNLDEAFTENWILQEFDQLTHTIEKIRKKNNIKVRFGRGYAKITRLDRKIRVRNDLTMTKET